MGGIKRSRAVVERAETIDTIARQARQRYSLQAWNRVTAAALVLYGVVVALAGESNPFTWGLVTAGLGACAAVLFFSRRGRHSPGGRLLLVAWLAALTWIGADHGPLGPWMLAAIIPIWAATAALSPPAGLVAGCSFALSQILLLIAAAAGWGPLTAHAQRVDLVVGYPLLMIVSGLTGWLFARAAQQATDQALALARSWEQGQQALENRAIERSRQVQEANRQLARHAKQIEVSAAIAQLGAQAAQPGELLQGAAKLLQSQLGFYHVLVCTLSADERRLILRASQGAAGPGLVERVAEIDLEETMVASRAIGTQAPVVAGSGSGSGSELTPALNLPLAQSWGAFPLIDAGVAIGVIEIYSEQATPFGGAMVAVMQAVTGVLALATGSGRRPSAPAAARAYDAVFAGRLEEVSKAGSVAEIAQILADTVASTPVAMSRVLLTERDRAGAEWIVQQEGWTAGDKPAEPAGTRLRLEDTPWAAFLSPTDLVVVEEIQTDRRSTEAVLIAARMADIRSMVSIPLIAGDEWLGTWLVGRAEPSVFDGPLVRRYLVLARLAAATMDNLRLRETVRRLMQHERLRAAIAGPLAAPSSGHELLESTVQAVGRILGAPRVAVHVGGMREPAHGE